MRAEVDKEFNIYVCIFKKQDSQTRQYYNFFTILLEYND